ncbi:MAG: benzoate-CoA ligase family protein [Candidatus Thermoplasmatota archaeon]
MTAPAHHQAEEFDYEGLFDAWKWDIPEHFNMAYDSCDKHVLGGKKEKIALYWENENGDARSYTFEDFRRLSNRFGNVLRGLGLRKGDRYIVRLPNIPEFQISFLGGLKIGAVPIPISTMFTAKEIAYRANDSGSVLVVTTPEYVKDVEAIRERCQSLRHIIIAGRAGREHLSFEELMSRSSEDLEIERTRAEDLAFFCYTSGTTGDPKGAVHLHRWTIGNDPGMRHWVDYREGDILAHTGNLNWIYPLGNGFLYAWRWGATILLYDGRFDPEQWFSLLEKYKVTVLQTVPTALRMMLTVGGVEQRYDLSHLRRVISAGEPLNPEVIMEWRRRFGHEIHDGIGMTEIMVYLSNMAGMPVKYGSCGRPQPGHRCAIVDSEGSVLPPHSSGTLAVHRSDPGLMRDYWNKPDKTAECLAGEWFLTGDMLFMDEDGYYWFKGRGDDLIKASGYRISPFEVESALIEHPAVLECAAVASPDRMRGNIVKAFVVLKGGYTPSEDLAMDIQNYVKHHYAAYKYPREIEFVPSLPKTQSGKIIRMQLRELEIERKGGR